MLPVSSRLGSYEILAPLGAGGMGEVYRAKDTRLGREVALKILPATFTNDPERLARFRREAQVLASLNHPHIGAIYGLEEANGTQFLVLELVDGESVDKRIARGKLPVDEALAIAKQIAEALEAAHEKGIIHRDLKPANIALTTDGNVKVLDFGLAKATENAAGTSLDVTNSPTITSPARMTSVGMILGTAAYMSPEQAKGRPADKRSDIWAFGCVLFEMLTGKSAFGAESMTEVLANVLRAEPDWRLVPGAIPGAVRHVVERCLRKDPARRFQHIGDARVELSEPFESLPTAANAPSRRRSRRMLTAWLASVAAAAILGGLAARFFGPRQPRPELRLDVATPPTTEPLSFALSPDGKQLAYVGTSGSASGLWIRTLDAGTTRHLAGTEDARQPFWSPDSQSLAFFATGRLARIDLENGAVRTLTNSINAFGGTWNRDGVVLFSGRAAGALLRMSADGGQVEDATHLGPQQLSHRSPQFLPDGQHFLYYATGGADARGIYVAELRHPQGRRVLDGESAGAYSNGFLLFEPCRESRRAVSVSAR